MFSCWVQIFEDRPRRVVWNKIRVFMGYESLLSENSENLSRDHNGRTHQTRISSSSSSSRVVIVLVLVLVRRRRSVSGQVAHRASAILHNSLRWASSQLFHPSSSFLSFSAIHRCSYYIPHVRCWSLLLPPERWSNSLLFFYDQVVSLIHNLVLGGPGDKNLAITIEFYLPEISFPSKIERKRR